MQSDDMLQIKLRDLDELSVGDWIEKAKTIMAKAENKFGYKVTEISVTVSVNPSATITLQPK